LVLDVGRRLRLMFLWMAARPDTYIRILHLLEKPEFITKVEKQNWARLGKVSAHLVVWILDLDLVRWVSLWRPPVVINSFHVLGHRLRRNHFWSSLASSRLARYIFQFFIYDLRFFSMCSRRQRQNVSARRRRLTASKSAPGKWRGTSCHPKKHFPRAFSTFNCATKVLLMVWRISLF